MEENCRRDALVSLGNLAVNATNQLLVMLYSLLQFAKQVFNIIILFWYTIDIQNGRLGCDHTMLSE